MDENIYEILNSYKDAIDLLLNRVDAQEEKIKSLEEQSAQLNSVLYDEILEPARQMLDEDARNGRFEEFKDKYGERLGAFDKVLGAAEGNPEFSMVKDAFDNYEELPEPRPEQDAFVDELISTVEGQIEEIKSSLGIAPDTEVTVTQDENGDTTIEADGEVVAAESTEETPATEEETVAPAEEGELKQAELPFDEEEEDNPEEVAEYEKQLEGLLK